MILLLGGTSETASIADRLAGAGLAVLVSTATAAALDVGTRPGIERRVGRLAAPAMAQLVHDQAITAIVDAGHPYAAELHATAQAVAARVAIPYFRFVRPAVAWDAADTTIVPVTDHAAAAATAFSFGKPVLLTTGSNHLAPYCQQAAQHGLPLVVRVLPERASLEACHQAGLADAAIIALRGPFSRQQNREHLRQVQAGVLVTKESGEAGGFAAKVAAARDEQCRVVVIQRPPETTQHAYQDVQALLAALAAGRILTQGV